MKRVDASKLDDLKAGTIVFVEVAHFKEEDGTTKVSWAPKERGRLIKAYSKQREIKENDKWTGKFETVNDLVVYEEIDKDGNKRPGYHYTVVMCGFFRLYTEE